MVIEIWCKLASWNRGMFYVFIFIYIYLYIYIYICIYICIFECVDTYLFIYLTPYTNIYTFIAYLHMHTFIYKHILIPTNIYRTWFGWARNKVLTQTECTFTAVGVVWWASTVLAPFVTKVYTYIFVCIYLCMLCIQ
jgi:hypothetical protein